MEHIMFIKSVTGLGTSSICVTIADENTGGSERLFISAPFYKKYETVCIQGTVVSEELYLKLKTSAERSAAVKEASRIIGSRDVSRYDLISRLKKRGISEDSAEYAADVLKRNGYLDEEAACIRIAEALVSSKHYGKRRIYEYLLMHHYDKANAQKAVSSIPESAYLKALRYNVGHKCPDIKSLPFEEKQKKIQSLLRLGFSGSEINEVLHSI